MVYGTYTSKIAEKTNQVTVPKPIVSVLGKTLILIPLPTQKFFRLYSKETADALVARQLKQPNTIDKEIGVAITSWSLLVTTDKQSRMTLPAIFIKKFDITFPSTIVFEAYTDYVRLWPEKFYNANSTVEQPKMEEVMRAFEHHI